MNMKTDPLERLVIENRDRFDTEVPGEGLWNRIDRPKAKVIRLNWKQVAWRAAAVAIIFTASYFFHDAMNRSQEGEVQLSGADAQEDMSPLAQKFLEAEVFYTAQINTRRQQVNELAKDDPVVMEEVNMELVELDQVYQELKNDLNDNADNEQVIEALIQNYRLKLQILEEMQYILEEAKQSEKIESYEYKRL
jgi:hypothetical protein